MKVRKGFVSNSSTSSFVIQGKSIEEVEAFLKGLTVFSNEYMPRDESFDVDTQCDSIYECLGVEYKKRIKDWFSAYSADYVMRALERITDDETVVVLEGESSNSISGTFFEIIERGLNATRTHLG